jgi:hypothetical protein
LALPSKKLLQQKLHELFENFNENEWRTNAWAINI